MPPSSDATAIYRHLTSEIRGRVELNHPLAPHTAYRIGGPTRLWTAPADEADLGRALTIVNRYPLPLFLLGRGSNVLVADDGWPGVTIYVGENISGWTIQGTEATVMAGTRLHDFISESVKQGFAGMERLAGIPGSIGGALRMNAGAFGQEIESTTVEVRGFRFDGSPVAIGHDAVGFGYRQAPGLEAMVISAGRFRFGSGRPDDLKSVVSRTLDRRSRRQPLSQPSCGSVFKRPEGFFAGALIENADLKGERVGGAMISPKHAGFIVNTGNATAADVYALICRIEQRVSARFGVRLEREVKLVGHFPPT